MDRQIGRAPLNSNRGKMPIRYTIDGARGLIWVEMKGDLTPEDVRSYRASLQVDPAYSPSMPRLIDSRGLLVIPSTRRIQALADAIAGRGLGIRAQRAIVASSDAYFGMFRMLEMLTDARTSERYRVFRSKEDALLWLGVDPNAEPPAALSNAS